MNYGIKISRPSYDVKTATPEQLSFSSKYSTFKIHSRGSGTVNSSTSGGLVTIPHGLGYTPAFLVHVDKGQLGNYCIAPYGESDTPLVYAYADSTNLYIKAVATTDTYTYTCSGTGDMWGEYEGFSSGNTSFYVGGKSDLLLGVYRRMFGAVRFTNVAIPQGTSVTSALLKVYISVKGAGSGDMLTQYWGIDEDNTSSFSSDPLGRTKTTASHSPNVSVGSVGNYQDFDVASEVNEIFARSGWSSGNALGFIFNPRDGTPDGVHIVDTNSTPNSQLQITISTATVANYKYTIFLNQLE